MPEKKLFQDFIKLRDQAFKISGDKQLVKGGRVYFNVDGTHCEIFFGALSPLEGFAYGFSWVSERGTYELLFGSSVWEDLFKTSDLVRQYLDLVLNTLISYKNRVDRLLK